MTSRYDGDIPPEWDRNDVAGDLHDPASGLRIREVEHYGGWIRSGDGTAVRDVDFIGMQDPSRRQGGFVGQARKSPGSTLLLLL